MRKGFFPSSMLHSSRESVVETLIPKCGACKLYQNCVSPKLPVWGKGGKKILIVLEFPGQLEDEMGKPLSGKTGSLLEGIMLQLGIDIEADCWVTYALICAPGREPKDQQLMYCRPNLIGTVKRLKPIVVIPLGQLAVKSLVSWAWRVQGVGAMNRWAGWAIPLRRPNMWICPTYAPSFIAASRDDVAEQVFTKHLEIAVTKKARPYKSEPPELEGKVTRVYNDDEAVALLKKYTGVPTPTAFDYETTSDKPERDGAVIVCASLSVGGVFTFSYPWHGKAIKATSDFLRSSTPKIASNLKFEERWTRHKLKHPVRNWAWDTMLAGHCLNNVPQVTGLKFLAFALLGIPSYNEHIEPYLKADDTGTGLNRIHEIDIGQLLLYCGLDSLLEYKIAAMQRRVMYA